MRDKLTVFIIAFFLILLIILLYLVIQGFIKKDFSMLQKYLNFYILGLVLIGALYIFNIIIK